MLKIYINSLKFCMFSKLKSVFGKQENPEAPPTDFKHPKMEDGDASMCPHMKNMKGGKTEASSTNKKNTKESKNSDS